MTHAESKTWECDNTFFEEHIEEEGNYLEALSEFREAFFDSQEATEEVWWEVFNGKQEAAFRGLLHKLLHPGSEKRQEVIARMQSILDEAIEVSFRCHYAES